MFRNSLKMSLAVLIAVAVGFGCGQAETSANENDKADTTKKEELKVTTDSSDPVAYRHPVRDEKNKIVSLVTNHGMMVLELWRDVAPAHADSFAARVNDEFYKNLIFHRVIEGFMIQGGDPTGTGTGDAGYNLDAEFSELLHKEGTLSMARSSNPNSASCQFFVCLGRTKQLDNQYTIFGQLLRGYDVLHSIGSTKTAGQNRPVEEVKILNCYASDAEGNSLKEEKSEEKEKSE